MSGYEKMNASPFWKKVMAVTGILCVVTLMTPPAFFFKYAIFDSPAEKAAALNTVSQNPPLNFHYVQLEMNRANSANSDINSRTIAINWLASLVLKPYAQITHPVECMLAKSTLSSLATDPNPSIKTVASNAITSVAQKGAVIER